MTTLLFPGRHLAHTTFQAQLLRQIVGVPLAQLPLTGDVPAAGAPVERVVFAITSANQSNSRYNPLDLAPRAIGVDRFARAIEQDLPFAYRIVPIPHYRPTPHFAHITLKTIAEASEQALMLTPANCIVLCSTPALVAQYRALGFAVHTAELASGAPTPIDLIRQLVAVGAAWPTDPVLRAQLAATTFDLWRDFPELPQRIWRIWREPLLTDSGGLTAERDYGSYVYRMGNSDIIELKYGDIRAGIVAGKIVDEGCADGALLARLAHDFPDSDLIGVEIAAEMLARCHERQRAGDFGGSFVHFHQRNILQPIFADGSIDTTICNSTIHELWSYGDGAATVTAYLAHKYAQTAPGGRLVIRDVTGPDAPETIVWLWLNASDGSNADPLAACADANALDRHLQQLSTLGRFVRFARDFRADAGAVPLAYRLEQRADAHYAVLKLRDACEFIGKFAYTNNWQSEMQEAFAFWSFADWKRALGAAGFRVLENPNAPQTGSRAYLNPWLVQNRYAGRVALFDAQPDGTLTPRPFPVSNVVLIAERAQSDAA